MRDPPSNSHSLTQPSTLLVILEGLNDISFLRTISRILAVDDETIPDLGSHSDRGALIFIPFGGGSPREWAYRFEPLGLSEVHVFDRELPPETETRLIAASQVNSRPNCVAFVTRYRALENCLHRDAIRAASRGTVSIEFGPNDCVPTAIARGWSEHGTSTPWKELCRREQMRQIQKAKRWLNRTAVTEMTRTLLEESDPDGDVVLWLRTIGCKLRENSMGLLAPNCEGQRAG